MEQDHKKYEPRCSNCERIPYLRFEIEGEAFMIAHDEEGPKTIQQAPFCPNAKKWFEAIEEEMNSIKSDRVWDLVDLPPGHRTIGNKWVVKIKRKADGTCHTPNTRLGG